MIEFNNLINNILYTDINSIISFKLFLFIISALIFALVVDMVFGELPTKVHPVVGIGNTIDFFKKHFIKIKNRSSGLLTVIGVYLVVSIVLYVIYAVFSFSSIVFFVIFVIVLSSTFSVNMLLQTATDVKDALDESIEKARQLVSYLVSRDTEKLSESFIVSAAIESLSENITDSYVAVVFYYFIFAIISLLYPVNDCVYYLMLIAMLYRVSNTMDAMLGYKTDELKDIGYVPAKIDDILNYIPARVAGIFIVISAYLLRLDARNAFRIMLRDARNCPSPNSGYTMATTAGALNIQLIKKGTYILGDDNKKIEKDDISNAVKLSEVSIILFTITIILLFTLIYVIL